MIKFIPCITIELAGIFQSLNIRVNRSCICLQFNFEVCLCSHELYFQITVNFLNLSLCEQAFVLKLRASLGAIASSDTATTLINRRIPLATYIAKFLLGFATLFAMAMTSNVNAADIFASTDANGQTKWSTQALDSSYHKTLSFPSNAIPALVVKSPAKPSPHQTILLERSLLIRPLVDTVARLHNVDGDLVMALIEIESGFNPQAISPKGARGLMQLMPATASRYGMRDAKELLDPARNLDIGIRHLKDLLAAHNGQWALAMASYNAGQHAVAKYGQRIPRYNETMLYVPAVLSAAVRQASATPAPPPLAPN
jgi:soluble lytic murein transglycosylase-like protein